MNKYYTPEIEEFHIGFEYEEYLKSEGEWNWECQKVEEVYEFTYYKDQINADNIRVKYLDKQDIEDLGFKQISGNWYHDGKTYQMIGNYKSLEISKGQHEHRDILFQGTVKNKSELKKLLKQLDIL